MSSTIMKSRTSHLYSIDPMHLSNGESPEEELQDLLSCHRDDPDLQLRKRKVTLMGQNYV